MDKSPKSAGELFNCCVIVSDPFLYSLCCYRSISEKMVARETIYSNDDHNRLMVEIEIIVDFSERRIKRETPTGGHNNNDPVMHTSGHIHG
jgi:hypothetical protein